MMKHASILGLIALGCVLVAGAWAQVSPPGPLPGQVNQPRVVTQPQAADPSTLATIASGTPAVTPAVPTPALPSNAHPDSGGLH